MSNIIDNQKIISMLSRSVDTSKEHVYEILTKAKELHGINSNEVLTLLSVTDKELTGEIFNTAKYIKQTIYGNRLVLFAPLYVSNLCNNECLYCAFRRSNKLLVRKALDQNEIKSEVEALLKQGHKRALLVAGESYPKEGLSYVFKSIETVYNTKIGNHGIRRVNVNIAPLSEDEFKELHKYNIGTYQLFQETYHEETYAKLHISGLKKNYEYRVSAMDRALKAGIADVGVGILFGLYDYKYEVLALLEHIAHLEKNFGVGPHTISVPRIEPALGSDVSLLPPYDISDEEFKRIIAVLRIAVPYTGIILSTRENAEMRKASFELGVSQISAGSRTNPGGYTHDEGKNDGVGTESQFSLGDSRSLSEVIEDITEHGYIPSFCTGCYRMGRVGKDFMDLAKPGLIKDHCLPNAMFTYAEYLYDFASDELKSKGLKLIEDMIKDDVSEVIQEKVRENLKNIENGKRDIYY